jgi:hypothetical protein
VIDVCWFDRFDPEEARLLGSRRGLGRRAASSPGPGGDADPRGQSRGRVAVERYERDQVGPAAAVTTASETNGVCLNFCSISTAIARRLGRSPATIRREIARHGGRGRYRAAEADRRAWDNARRPQRCKLALHPALCKARRVQAQRGLVARADRWLEEARQSGESHLQGVARDDLPDPVHPDAPGRRSASCCCVCEGPVPSAGPRSRRASIPARGRSVMRLDSRAPHRRPRTVRLPVTGRGTCLRGRRLEGLAGLAGGGDPPEAETPRIRTPPSAGTWIARMRVARQTRNLLLCPTDQATGHSYSTSGCAIVCMPAY